MNPRERYKHDVRFRAAVDATRTLLEQGLLTVHDAVSASVLGSQLYAEDNLAPISVVMVEPAPGKKKRTRAAEPAPAPAEIERLLPQVHDGVLHPARDHVADEDVRDMSDSDLGTELSARCDVGAGRLCTLIHQASSRLQARGGPRTDEALEHLRKLVPQWRAAAGWHRAQAGSEPPGGPRELNEGKAFAFDTCADELEARCKP